MGSQHSQRARSTDGLARRFENGPPLDCAPQPAAPIGLLVRARWVILLLLGVYVLYAATFYSFSRFGFILSPEQGAFLLLSLGFVALYNLSYQDATRRLSRFRYASHLQVVLDTLLVTVLVHFSGGAASWGWPLYLMVAIEAVYLLERRAEVWFAWCASAVFYGTLLLCEHNGVIRGVRMPFVDPRLTDDSVYLLLIWFWVVILNAAVSEIGFHLMSVARSEARQVKESEERLFAFLEHADDLIHMTAPDGRFLYANRAWLKGLGHQRGKLPGLSLADVVHPGYLERFLDTCARVLSEGEGITLDSVFVGEGGSPIDVEVNLSCSLREGERVAIWAVCRDVTDKKRAEEQLYRMAHYDVLTGLPNRMLFMDRLQQMRAMSYRMEQRMGVLFLDLDRFKQINDTLGHDVGDKLLQEVAKRLGKSVRGMDTVARLGGDEFVIALCNLRDQAGAETVARKVLAALSAPVRIDQHEIQVSSSIGISIYPEDGYQLEDLLKKADLALYQAKGEGRACFRRYAEAAPIDGGGDASNGNGGVHPGRKRGKTEK